MARTAPVPNLPPIPGMCPGVAVLAGGAGSGGKGGKGAGSGGGGTGADGEGGAGDASGDEREGGCAEGDPVCPITGRMFVQVFDFGFSGPLPLRWERAYNSRTSATAGDLGHGWTHPFGWSIRLRRRSATVLDDKGREQVFQVPPEDGSWTKNGLGWALRRQGEGLVLFRPRDLREMSFGPRCGDGRHLLESVADHFGNRIVIKRDPAGRIVGLVDSAGRSYEVVSDKLGRILRIKVATNEDNSAWMTVAEYSYDQHGDLVMARDAEQYEASYHYSQHLMVEHRSVSGLSYFYRYDGRTQSAYCVETWGEYSGYIDPALHKPLPVRPSERTDCRTVKGIHYVKLTYDKDDNYCEAEDGFGGLTRYFGDAKGRMVKMVDPAGDVIERQYDPQTGGLLRQSDTQGRERKVDLDDTGSAQGYTDGSGKGTVSFDVPERSVRVVFNEHDESFVEKYYDGVGNVTAIKHIDKTVQEFGYDKRGLLLWQLNRQGGKVTYDRDKQGNLLKLEMPGRGVETNEYDYLGRRVAHVDPSGRRTEWEYDRRSEVIVKRLPAGGVVRVTRDANRKPIRIDDSGAVTEYRWGGMAWLMARTEPNGRKTEYRYDLEGRLVLVRNARGQEFQQFYDAVGNLTTTIDFEGRRVERGYGPGGAILWIDGPDGRVSVDYDDMGRVTEVDAPSETVSFLQGHYAPTCMDNGTVKLDRAYDQMGRVRTEKQGDHELKLSWHGGELASLTPDQGLAVSYQHGVTGDETAVRAGGTTLWINHPQGRDLLTYLGDDLVLRRHFNVAGKLQRQGLARQDVKVAAELAGSADDPNILRWTSYEYDTQMRLKSEFHSNGTGVEYELELAGQIIGKRVYRNKKQIAEETLAYDAAGSPIMPGAHYDALMRPKTLHGETFEYDAAGRLSKRTTDAGEWLYEWNSFDHLVKVTAPNHVVEMDYDARARRVRKRVLREGAIVSSTSYQWSNNTLLQELDELSGDTRTYLRESDRWTTLGHVDCVAGKERAYLYLLNPAGGVDAAVDSSGRVVWEANQTVFGHCTPTTNDVEVTARYQNQYYDPDVQLVYNRYRWYEPRLGMYVTTDPSLTHGTINPRDYVTNPLQLCDPLGLMPQHPGVGSGQSTGNHWPSPESPAVAHPNESPPDDGLSAEYLSGPGHWSNNTPPPEPGTGQQAGYATCPENALRRGSGFGTVNRATSAQSVVDAAGSSYGCHSCGTRDSGYKDYTRRDGSVGQHWTCDHQPPRGTFSNHTRKKTGDQAHYDRASASNVRLYPHCRSCSTEQRDRIRRMPVNDRVTACQSTWSNYGSGTW